jgi:hypothetical protein
MRRDKLVKQAFEPISQNLRDNLIDDVAKTDRTEMLHRRSPYLFKNKSNERMIMLLLKVVVSKEIPNTRKNHIFDNAPIFFIEKGNEPIRTWSFGRSHI